MQGRPHQQHDRARRTRAAARWGWEERVRTLQWECGAGGVFEIEGCHLGGLDWWVFLFLDRGR